MKQFIVLFAIALFGSNAFAVETKDCPNKLTVTVSDFYMEVTEAGLIRKLEGYYKDNLEYTDAIRTGYKRLDRKNQVRLSFRQTSKGGGKCIYGYRKTMEKIEIYGDKKMYVQSNLGPRGILVRNYLDIKVLKPDYVELENEGSLALAIPRYPYTNYTAGGDLHFVGKSKTARATTK